MAKSTDRHARESLAKIGKEVRLSTTSIRKAGVIEKTFTDGEEALMSGKYNINELYKLATGDTRVGLHLLMPKELRETIKTYAKAEGKKVNDMIVETLTKLYWHEME